MPTAGQPAKLPVVPGREEVVCIPDTVHILRNRVVPATCYVAGLRISEAVSPRPTDIDSGRMVVRVDQGKGGKDRYVMLSERLTETLLDFWRRTRPAGEWLFPHRIPGRQGANGGVHPSRPRGSDRAVRSLAHWCHGFWSRDETSRSAGCEPAELTRRV